MNNRQTALKILKDFYVKYEPNFSKKVDEELFNKCYDAFEDELDGVDIFLSCMAYREVDYFDDPDICQFSDEVDYYKSLTIDLYCQNQELAKDKLIYLYHKLMENSEYSKETAYLLSKALDYCIPF